MIRILKIFFVILITVQNVKSASLEESVNFMSKDIAMQVLLLQEYRNKKPEIFINSDYLKDYDSKATLPFSEVLCMQLKTAMKSTNAFEIIDRRLETALFLQGMYIRKNDSIEIHLELNKGGISAEGSHLTTIAKTTGLPITSWEKNWFEDDIKKRISDLIKKIQDKYIARNSSETIAVASFVRQGAKPDKDPLGEYMASLSSSFLTQTSCFKVVGEKNAALILKGEYLFLDNQNIELWITLFKKDNMKESDFVRFPSSILPANFNQSLDNKIKSLADKLIANRKGFMICMKPILESKNKYCSDFSEYIALRIKDKVNSLGNTLLSECNTSNINPSISGVYFIRQSIVEVSIELKNANGIVISSAYEEIDKSIIYVSIDNPEAHKLSVIADVPSQDMSEMVKISTLEKGDLYTIFKEGDTLSLVVYVKKPLYVYLYNITSDNRVNLLYPDVDYGDKIIKITPEKPYRFPTMKIKGPKFGQEIVKVFASNKILKTPTISKNIEVISFINGTRDIGREEREHIQAELSVNNAINGLDLVDFYRGVARDNKAELYEDSIFIKTRN
ncbi:MAG: DUF4384 domain-containing protein [Desulfobacterales bacterium]|nr:DUF4384 domain-containing protein [Desulfobacterales bacterium]